MKFNGYHHIGLIVEDAEKSLEFYKKLGGEVVFSFPMSGDTSKTIVLVDLGQNAVVEIIPRGQKGPQANARWAHIALATDNVREAHALALAAGAVSQSEPNDIVLGTKAVCNSFVVGPEGELIEFFQTK